jgi:hypothetical protein
MINHEETKGAKIFPGPSISDRIGYALRFFLRRRFKFRRRRAALVPQTSCPPHFNFAQTRRDAVS